MITALAFGAALLGGCASARSRAAFGEIEALIRERTGHRVAWTTGTPEDASVEAAVRAMLADELTGPEAVQIALLNSPRLRARYEELGIAQADLVQAGLLGNPVFSATVQFAEGGAHRPTLEYAVVQPFTEVLLLPVSSRLAREQLAQAQARVAHEVLAVATEAKRAHLEWVAAQTELPIRREMVEAADLAADFARRQRRVGNISELVLTDREIEAQRARIALAEARVRAVEASEELTRVLGLTGEAPLRAPAALPPLPAHDPPLAGLEALAVSQRLDLRAARQAGAVNRQLQRLAWLSPFADIRAGVEAERDLEEIWVTGPTIEVGLPVFDWGRARRARLAAEARQISEEVRALEVEVRSQTRRAHAAMTVARETAEQTERRLLPLQQRLTDLTQLYYNAMFTGLYDLLSTKIQELETRLMLTEALHSYWDARADLEAAIGGELPVESNRLPPLPPPPQRERGDERPAHTHHSDHGGAL